MKIKSILFSALALSIFSACTPSNEEAKFANISEATTASIISPEAIKYEMDSSFSWVTWVGSKPVGKHIGTIDINDGYVGINGSTIEGGKITLDMNTITSLDLRDDYVNLKKLITHLKSADFFDVENHPQAFFEITKITAFDSAVAPLIDREEFETEFKPEDAQAYMISDPTHTIFGNLTMRGTTLNVGFPARVSMDTSRIVAVAKFNIDRSLWNLKYGDEASVADKTKDQFIYNTVNIGFRFVGKPVEE